MIALVFLQLITAVSTFALGIYMLVDEKRRFGKAWDALPFASAEFTLGIVMIAMALETAGWV